MGSAQSISCATLSASCAEGSVGSAQSTSFATSSASCAARSGKYQVDPELTAASNKTVTVLDIGHYRVCSKNGRSIILHDFVGLHVRFRGGTICNIRAEKGVLPVGISVSRPIEDWDADDVQMKHRAEELEDCGNIRMEDLLAILTEPSPDYSLTSDNCWKYADATFKQVIRKFLETPSLTPDRRSYLASFLNNPPPVMPVNVIRSFIFKTIQALWGPTFLYIFTQIGLALERGFIMELGVEHARLFAALGPTPPIWVGVWLPVYIFGGLVAFWALCEIVAWVMDGTSIRQDIKKRWRSLRFRRPCLRSLRFRRPLQQQPHGLPLM